MTWRHYYTSRYVLWDTVKHMDCSGVGHFTFFLPVSGEGYLKILSWTHSFKKSIPAYLNDLSCLLIFSVYFDDFKTVDTSKNYRCVEIWSSFLPRKIHRLWLLHFIQNSYTRKATLKLLPRCFVPRRVEQCPVVWVLGHKFPLEQSTTPPVSLIVCTLTNTTRCVILN